MVGGIKASSPSVKSMSADMCPPYPFLDLLTMSAPTLARSVSWGNPHRPQVERAGLCLRRRRFTFSGAQPARVGVYAVRARR
jgi:hypothetical protein